MREVYTITGNSSFSDCMLRKGQALLYRNYLDGFDAKFLRSLAIDAQVI